jgi:hypothetical protein
MFNTIVKRVGILAMIAMFGFVTFAPHQADAQLYSTYKRTGCGNQSNACR